MHQRTFQIHADRLGRNRFVEGDPVLYSLAVDGQQLRPFVENMDEGDYGRDVMLTLLAFPGLRPTVCFDIDDSFGGGSVLDHPLDEYSVMGMLVQSRRLKLMLDEHAERRHGSGRGRRGHEMEQEEEVCERCLDMDCGLGYLSPFPECCHLQGVFDGLCGNSLWNRQGIRASDSSSSSDGVSDSDC